MILTKETTEKEIKRAKELMEISLSRAIIEAPLGKDSAQKLIKNSDKLQSCIIAAIKELSGSNQLVDERVDSSYLYPEGFEIKSVAEQVAIIKKCFPELENATYDKKIAMQSLPLGAEGYHAIIRWQKIAPTYGEAVEKIFDVVKSNSSGRFYKALSDRERDPKYLRQHVKTMESFQKIENEQKGHDILIVPCQFGAGYSGCSVRLARKTFKDNEFGLGLFAVGCMFLSHPKREMQWEQLHVDCAGDEFAPEGDGNFSGVPIIYYAHDTVWVDTRWYDRPEKYCGSASAFLSQ